MIVEVLFDCVAPGDGGGGAGVDCDPYVKGVVIISISFTVANYQYFWCSRRNDNIF